MDGRLILLGLLAAVLTGIVVCIVLRRRVTPGERERRRRLQISRIGRMSDGTLTDLQDSWLYFSYSVRGVDYTASQDVSDLDGFIDRDRDALIGPVTLKYSPRNPANSIVICEEWSGLRPRSAILTTEETNAT
jgi:hypothetical protein